MFDFKAGEQEFRDIEVAQGMWNRAKERMEWCRKAAQEFVDKGGRRKFYKLSYRVDPGQITVYASFDEEDKKLILDTIANADDDLRECENFIECLALQHIDIDWSRYIPEGDMHWIESPVITDVDFDDVCYCTVFISRHTKWNNDDTEALEDANVCVLMDDDVFVNLVAARLFDERLTFYDLKDLYEDVYNDVLETARRPHQHHMVFMTEIDAVAKAILDDTKEEDIPKGVNYDTFFAPIILNAIFEHPEQFDDKQLYDALSVASSFLDFTED